MSDEDRTLARIEALEAQIAELRSALHAGPDRRASMADDGRCPACGCKRLLHATEVPADAQGRGKLALTRAGAFGWSPHRPGPFELWVCTRCRLVEWHVESLDDVDADGQLIELIDGEDGASGGPYR
jgi:hypothetical protein